MHSRSRSLYFTETQHSPMSTHLIIIRLGKTKIRKIKKIENTEVKQSIRRKSNSKPQIQSYLWIVNLSALYLCVISTVTMLTDAAVLTRCVDFSVALTPLSSSLQTDTTCWDQKQWKVCSTCTDSLRTTNIETGDGTYCRALITTLRYRQLATDQFSLELLHYIFSYT